MVSVRVGKKGGQVLQSPKIPDFDRASWNLVVPNIFSGRSSRIPVPGSWTEVPGYVKVGDM